MTPTERAEIVALIERGKTLYEIVQIARVSYAEAAVVINSVADREIETSTRSPKISAVVEPPVESKKVEIVNWGRGRMIGVEE